MNFCKMPQIYYRPCMCELKVLLAENTPKTDSVPLIGLYIMWSFILTAEHLFACCIILRLHKMGDREANPLIRALILRPSIHALQSMDRTVRRMRQKIGLRTSAETHYRITEKTAATASGNQIRMSECPEHDANTAQLPSPELAAQTKSVRLEPHEMNPIRVEANASNENTGHENPLPQSKSDTTRKENEPVIVNKLQVSTPSGVQSEPLDEVLHGPSIKLHECGIEVKENLLISGEHLHFILNYFT